MMMGIIYGPGILLVIENRNCSKLGDSFNILCSYSAKWMYTKLCNIFNPKGGDVIKILCVTSETRQPQDN